jgi:Spy/CpxP family protein refolding chaperone
MRGSSRALTRARRDDDYAIDSMNILNARIVALSGSRMLLTLLLVFFGVSLVAANVSADTAKEEPAARGLLRELEKLHEKLHLKPEQETLWEIARRKSVETQTEVRAAKRALIEQSEIELERPTPDLGEIERKFEAVEQHNLLLERESRGLWLKLYDALTPEQKGIVRNALKSQLARYKLFQNLRQRFLE